MDNIMPGGQTYVFILMEELEQRIDAIFQKRIMEKQEEELQARFLSPNEVCNLFKPKISLVTLNSWAAKGFLNKHYIGGRTYYKYGEIMESLKTLKKYGR